VLRSRLRSRDGEERPGLRSRCPPSRSRTLVLLPCPFGLPGPAELLCRAGEAMAPPVVETTVRLACPVGASSLAEALRGAAEGMKPWIVMLVVLPACPLGLTGPAEFCGHGAKVS
jgi:hypothetical protein